MSRAQETFFAADRRNPQQGVQFAIELPEKVLEPDETVYEYARCALVRDAFPVLVVTDRRILHALYNMFRVWAIKDQVPSAEVTGAAFARRLLSARVHVHRRSGKDLTVKVAHPSWPAHVVELINHLAAGGEPPRV